MTNKKKPIKSRAKPSWLEGLGRMIRYRLHIPMKRSSHPPHFIARGVMVGIMWAMTPFFGLQMTLVFLTWLFARRVLKWDFSLVNGLAWTWTTNVFTIIPVFYVFYVTGQTLLGQVGDISGYENFKGLFVVLNEPGSGLTGLVSKWFAAFLVGVGLPLTVGSIPWAVLSGAIAYRMSLRFVTEFRARRTHKMRMAADKNGRKQKPSRKDPVIHNSTQTESR